MVPSGLDPPPLDLGPALNDVCEKWCKRAIWGNTLPAVKQAWKSVDRLTSEAFVGMWRARVAEFRSKYMATAAVGGAKQ